MVIRASKPAFSIREKLKSLDYSHLPYERINPGGLVQVVRGWTQTVDISTAADTFRDTGLEATIYPKFENSKILIMINQSIGALPPAGASIWIDIRLQRTIDGTTSTMFANTANNTIHVYSTAYTLPSDVNYGEHSFTEIDEPNTLNAVTYKTQHTISSTSGGSSRAQPDASSSTIILMEIKQ